MNGGNSAQETKNTRSRLGREGEEAASLFLQGLGWRLLERNWRPGGTFHRLELDLIGMEGDALIFVEVKTRRYSHERDRAAFPVYAAFTARKRHNLIQASRLYRSSRGLWDLPCRFDLVCVEILPDGRQSVERHRNVIEFGHTVDCGHTPWQPW
jgi:putative endonuclease